VLAGADVLEPLVDCEIGQQGLDVVLKLLVNNFVVLDVALDVVKGMQPEVGLKKGYS
jgi:hypothetical protein